MKQLKQTTLPFAKDTVKQKRVHHKEAKFDIYIGRPSEWGNPFIINVHGDRDRVVSLFDSWLWDKKRERLAYRNRVRKELAGKILGCWCPSSAKCHGDSLVACAETPFESTVVVG
jgi:hypothetical protein